MRVKVDNMTMAKKTGIILAIVIILILIADQFSKIWVKTHYYMGEEHEVTSWFVIKFIQNNGMAFGMELISKYILTFGRIVAVGLLLWGLYRVLPCDKLRRGFLISIALIIAGAAGNVFDCVFYGKIFNDPNPPGVATIFPDGGGYAGWFQGRVVDMLYFPFFSFTWPEWLPVIGGKEFEFFQYIFNVADAAITIGVLMLIIFYTRDLRTAWSYFKDDRQMRKEKRRAQIEEGRNTEE